MSGFWVARPILHSKLVLSRDGRIQINYAPTFDVSLLSSATVGTKTAGSSNPQRYLIHFNATTSPWIAPNARIRLTPTPPFPILRVQSQRRRIS